MCGHGFYFLVSFGLLATVQTSAAQTAPPDIPRNLIAPVLIPYEQGMADMEARAAAGPQAVQPILPQAGAGSLTSSSASPFNQPDPAGGFRTPGPR
jgi:hypothetical protein